MELKFDYKILGRSFSSRYEIEPTAVAVWPKDNPDDVLIYFYVEEIVAYGRALLGTNMKYGIEAFKRDLEEYTEKELEIFKGSSITPKDTDYTFEFLAFLSLEEIKRYLIDAGFKMRVKKTGFKLKYNEVIYE